MLDISLLSFVQVFLKGLGSGFFFFFYLANTSYTEKRFSFSERVLLGNIGLPGTQDLPIHPQGLYTCGVISSFIVLDFY